MRLRLVDFVEDDTDGTYNYPDAALVKILWIKLENKVSVTNKGEKVMLAGALTSTVNLDDGQNFKFQGKIYVIVENKEGLNAIGFFTYRFKNADLEE